MNNAEAKFILQGYRPNGADAEDATFRAALEQARNDPVLGQWLAQQQAFDAAVSTKLAQVPVPADLRAAILAGGHVTSAGASPRRWWSHPAGLAVAAGVTVLLAAGVALWPKQAAAFDEFALADARLGATHGHGGRGGAIEALQQQLSQPTTRLGQKLPVDYATLHNIGCRSINYHDRDVLEICFNRNGAWFHCYIAKAADFPRLAQGSTPAIVEKGSAAIASWTDEAHVIVVVSMSGRKNLEALL